MRLVVALRDDAMDLVVDRARRLLAERARAAEALETGPPREIRILVRRELHHAESVAHPPARHHVARELRRLLDVVLGARRLRAVHDLLGGASAEHADDARAQIRLREVVAIARRDAGT